jgi:hypothetical protein
MFALIGDFFLSISSFSFLAAAEINKRKLKDFLTSPLRAAFMRAAFATFRFWRVSPPVERTFNMFA